MYSLAYNSCNYISYTTVPSKSFSSFLSSFLDLCSHFLILSPLVEGDGQHDETYSRSNRDLHPHHGCVWGSCCTETRGPFLPVSFNFPWLLCWFHNAAYCVVELLFAYMNFQKLYWYNFSLSLWVCCIFFMIFSPWLYIYLFCYFSEQCVIILISGVSG